MVDELKYEVKKNVSADVAMEVTLPIEKSTTKTRKAGRPIGSKNLTAIKNRANKLTPNKIKQFLRVLEKIGSISSAASYCNVTRDAIYKRMKRDPAFKESVEIANGKFTVVLEEAAFARGVEGVDEPILSKSGEVIGHKKKYSDALLLKLMSAADSERYGNNTKNETTIKQDVTINAGESAKDKLASMFGLSSVEKDITPKPEAIEYDGDDYEDSNADDICEDGNE